MHTLGYTQMWQRILCARILLSTGRRHRLPLLLSPFEMALEKHISFIAVEQHRALTVLGVGCVICQSRIRSGGMEVLGLILADLRRQLWALTSQKLQA